MDKIPLTSDIAMMGRKRQNSKYKLMKIPKLPNNISPSYIVGLKYPHELGRKSRLKEVTVITNRSNHIPMFTKTQMTTIQNRDVRSFLNQNNCGEITLQETIVQ
jgi:hypothetical protein